MPIDDSRVIRKALRLQRESHVRLLARFAALQQLLIEKGHVSRTEIEQREKHVLKQAMDHVIEEDLQEQLLQLFESPKGPLQ